MWAAAPISRLHSQFLYCPLKLSSTSSPSSISYKSFKTQRAPASYPRVRAVDLDQNTIVAITVGVVSVAFGIGIPVFYENQIDSAAKRENTQPCFPCSGSGAPFPKEKILSHASPAAAAVLGFSAEQCRFCMGSGSVVVELGGDEKEVSRCINCDGVGSLTCTTCQGSGIQPRYLDRREFKDDD